MSDPEPARERAINAPWPVTVLVVVLVAAFLIQGWMTEAAWLNYALTPVDLLRYGRWETLVTSLFLHGGWIHLLMNAVAALAFGTPVARLFGTRQAGAGAFFLFYLACGLLAGLGFVALDPGGVNPVIGASGAVSGLMGAASRLVDGRGRLGPILARTPVAMGLSWVAVNLVFGFTVLTPGAGGAPIAWQAHLAGYAAGLLLIGPFARVLRRD